MFMLLALSQTKIFSKKSLSLLIALTMVFNAMMFSTSSAVVNAQETPIESEEVVSDPEIAEEIVDEEEIIETDIPTEEEVEVEQVVENIESQQVQAKSQQVIEPAGPLCEDQLITTNSPEECEPDEDPVTLRDLIRENPNTVHINRALNLLEENDSCGSTIYALQDEKSESTAFIPTDEAFLNLVRLPGNVINETFQLGANLDELCQLISYHVVPEEALLAIDVPTTPTNYETYSWDLMLLLERNGSQVTADQSTVVDADNVADNGVLHLIDDTLLPTQSGSIDPISTDSTSPELSGSIDAGLFPVHDIEFQYCVLVRIDGVPYLADVDGLNWVIEEGTVLLDPLNEETLFDVVVRLAASHFPTAQEAYTCDIIFEDLITAQTATLATVNSLPDPVTHGGPLLGLTMTRGIVTFEEPHEPEEPVDDGEVLGDTSEPTTTSCGGKADCATGTGGEYDPTKVDTDGDGVVDAEDPDPNDPTITGRDGDSANQDGDTDAEDSDEEDESSTNFIWWFIGGAAVVVLWYLLWQRGGREDI